VFGELLEELGEMKISPAPEVGCFSELSDFFNQFQANLSLMLMMSISQYIDL